MNINKVTIIGAGTMGNGIAHVFALKGFSVDLIDKSDNILNEAKSKISTNLERQLKKDIINASEKEQALRNITLISQIDNIDMKSDLVIEAIIENITVKLDLWSKVDKLVNESSLFATNTSAISITELSANIRPDRFIGMHFMNPVPVMKLVEIIRGYSTSDETFNSIKEITLKLDKEPVEVSDYPGFISNRILMPMINEAIYTLYEGVATAEDIDTVMKLGMAHPMGPLTLADFIGLDVCLDIMNVLYDGFKDSKYRPCPLLKKMVAANKIGRKVKEGFFLYE